MKVAKEQAYTKSLIATLLSVVAVIILLTQAIYILVNPNLLIQRLATEMGTVTAQALANAFMWLAIVWIVLAVVLIISLVRVNKDNKRWKEILTIGIITVVSLRLLSGLVVIISSLIFKPFKPTRKR